MKPCNFCKETKELKDFPKNSNVKSGYAGYCKQCKKAKYNYKRTRHQRRIEHLKHTYGLSEEQYVEILSDQEFACVLCDTDLQAFDKNTHVDHCHSTGEVRGILCGTCNRNLGHYEKFKRLNLFAKYDQYLGD